MIGRDVENPWARIIYQEDEEQEGAITTKKIIEESFIQKVIVTLSCVIVLL